MRWWTAIAIIAICGFSVIQGWRIAHFSLARAMIDLSKQRAENIEPWTAVPNVASAALRVELRENVDTLDPNAINRRYETLSSLPSIKPLSSIDWLSLAATQLAMDRP